MVYWICGGSVRVGVWFGKLRGVMRMERGKEGAGKECWRGLVRWRRNWRAYGLEDTWIRLCYNEAYCGGSLLEGGG